MMLREDDKETLEMVLLNPDDAEVKHLEYHSVISNYWYDLSFEMIRWVDGRSVKLCTLYDISEIKQYQKRIERQANMDYLTGLYNRKRCEIDLDVEIKNAIRMVPMEHFFILIWMILRISMMDWDTPWGMLCWWLWQMNYRKSQAQESRHIVLVEMSLR